MILLTADIHNQSLKTENQKHSDLTELDTTYMYFKAIEKLGLKATFFISGKVFTEDWNEKLEEICQSPLIEIGGHNWDCFENQLYHRVCNKLLKSYNGTKAFQKRDCEKTKEIIFKKTNREIRSWRNHMYMHGVYTEEVLAECGIDIISDGVKKGPLQFIKDPIHDIYNLPINCIPDHEHIYHAERTPLWVKQWLERYSWEDDFGKESYYIQKWGEILIENIALNDINNSASLMLIHPLTMYLADRFNFFYQLVEFLKDQHTATLSEALKIYEFDKVLKTSEAA
jgi:hypothetical protein